MLKKHALLGVILCTVCLGLALAGTTYYINFWPTDSEFPYLPTAAKLFTLQHISDIHDLPWRGVLRVNMHGKETLIVGIAIFQKLLNDAQTLYPNILFLIMAVGLSAVLIYCITARLLDVPTGLVIYALFISCFWPYMYIIMGAHPPLGLFFFLLAVFFLLKAPGKIFYLFSGLSLGLMLFSTPTAPVYLPYYAALYFFVNWRYKLLSRSAVLPRVGEVLLIAAGIGSIFALFTFPDPVTNMKDYFKFMEYSQRGNNFTYYNDYLERFFPVDKTLRGGGWIWIFKYAFLILPVIFPLYLASVLYLLKLSFDRRFLLVLILLSAVAPWAIEISGVVQFGRNYFVWYFGLLAAIAFAFFEIKNKLAKTSAKAQGLFWGVTLAVLTVHAAWNVSVYVGEILPSRLVTTRIHDWAIKNNVKELYAFREHPLNTNIVEHFNNPKRKEPVKFHFIDNLSEARSGYVLIPPITGKTLYVECRFDNFYLDPVLTELYLSGRLKQFTVASFPSMAVSQIWNMEEEICAYRDLILKQVSAEDRRKGRVWILDAGKLHAWLASKEQ